MPAPIVETEFGHQIGDVEFIWARNSKEFLFSNSIYIKGSPAILIDPSATFTYIEKLAVTHAIQIVLNTHYHGDHRCLNGLFKNVVFASHEADAPCIRDHQTYEEYADSDPNSFYSEWRKQVFHKYHIVDCPVSMLLKDQQIIETSGTKILVHHIPGHTPGHIALYFEPIRLLYLSDIDLTPYGPWYANIFSDIDQFKSSVAKMMSIDADYYVTSHGERIYDREKFTDKITKFYDHFQKRDERILELLKVGPKEFVQIASEAIVYRKPSLMDPLKAYFQWQMVKKHLDRLIKLGLVIQDDQKFELLK